MEMRRARSMSSNNVSGMMRQSGNDVVSSASTFPIVRGVQSTDTDRLPLGLCQSILTRTYRVVCRHLRRWGELRSRKSSSTRTMLLMVMPRENVMMIMVVRRPHRDRKPWAIPPKRLLHDMTFFKNLLYRHPFPFLVPFLT